MNAKTATPYDELHRALCQVDAARLAVCSGPNKKPHPGASELEFWLVPQPADRAPRMVIIQRWTHPGSFGGFDVYLQSNEHKTTASIAEILGRTQ